MSLGNLVAAAKKVLVLENLVEACLHLTCDIQWSDTNHSLIEKWQAKINSYSHHVGVVSNVALICIT